MQITYTNSKGELEYIDAQIDANTLKEILGQYVLAPQKRYRRFELHNCENISKLNTNLMYYPSAPTGNLTEFGYHHIGNYQSQEKCYRQTHTKEWAVARFVVSINDHMMNNYFKKGYTPFLGASSFQQSMTFLPILTSSLSQLNAILDGVQLGAFCRIFFIPNEQAQDYLALEHMGQNYLKELSNYPWMEVNLSSDVVYDENHIEAQKTFKKIVVADRDFGILPEQRTFIARLEDGRAGILYTAKFNDKSANYIKRIFKNKLVSPIKGLTEINREHLARIQGGASFHAIMD